jgi:hypothetical protein
MWILFGTNHNTVEQEPYVYFIGIFDNIDTANEKRQLCISTEDAKSDDCHRLCVGSTSSPPQNCEARRPVDFGRDAQERPKGAPGCFATGEPTKEVRRSSHSGTAILDDYFIKEVELNRLYDLDWSNGL